MFFLDENNNIVQQDETVLGDREEMIESLEREIARMEADIEGKRKVIDMFNNL